MSTTDPPGEAPLAMPGLSWWMLARLTLMSGAVLGLILIVAWMVVVWARQ